MDGGRGNRGSRGRGRGATRGGGRGRSHSASSGAARGSGTNKHDRDSGSKRGASSGGASRGRGGKQERRDGRGVGRNGTVGRGRGRGSKGGGRGDRSNDGSSSGQADGLPANKKRRLKLERQQQRPEFDTVSRAKQIWNKLRERKVPLEERTKLVQELLRIIKGKVLAIAMKHDASRVVQTALQFGNREERLALFEEMENHLVELSQLMYSHHIVQRLFRDVKAPEDQKRLAKTFRGHGVRLATHAIGAEVVQTALISLPTASASLIKSEFYGKEFALFDDGDGQPKSLKAVLEARPDRRSVVMEHVNGVIGKLLTKGIMKFQFAHDLLLEYLQEATPLQIQEMVPQLLEPFLLLLSTRAGSMCAAMCVAHGGAKERKRMIRSLKGHVAASLVHRDSYLAVMRLVESVDDTITCQKTILAELLKPSELSREEAANSVPKAGKGTSAEDWVPKGNTAPRGGDGKDGVTGMDVDEPLEDGRGGKKEDEVEDDSDVPPPALLEVMTSRNGCKLLLRLLAPERTGYIQPEELELLKPTMVPAPTSKSKDASGMKEKEETKLVPSSKKDPSVRRRELLGYLREPLREVCASHAGELMRSKCAGALVLLETVRVVGTPQLVQAVVEAACAKPLEGQLPMFEDAVGHLFMKQFLKREATAQREAKSPHDPGDESDSSPTSAPCFAEALLDRAGVEIVSWVGSNRGAFVVAALEDVPTASARVREIFGAEAARMKVLEAAKAEGKNVGVKVLAEHLGYGDFGAKSATEASDRAETPAEKNSEQKNQKD